MVACLLPPSQPATDEGEMALDSVALGGRGNPHLASALASAGAAPTVARPTAAASSSARLVVAASPRESFAASSLSASAMARQSRSASTLQGVVQNRHRSQREQQTRTLLYQPSRVLS